MTGQSTLSVQILVDGWPEDGIENWAWVEVTAETTTPEGAVAFLERKFPAGELEEGCRYHCGGDKEWYQPMGEYAPDGKYRVFDPAPTDPDDPRYGQPRTYTDYEPEEGPWTVCEPITPGVKMYKGNAPTDAKQFWVIEVVEET